MQSKYKRNYKFKKSNKINALNDCEWIYVQVCLAIAKQRHKRLIDEELLFQKAKKGDKKALQYFQDEYKLKQFTHKEIDKIRKKENYNGNLRTN